MNIYTYIYTHTVHVTKEGNSDKNMARMVISEMFFCMNHDPQIFADL